MNRIQAAGFLLVLPAALAGAADLEMPPLHSSESASLWETGADSALDGLVREAMEKNPELAVLRHALEAARHRVPQAGALDDPMAGIVFLNLPADSFALDETPMTGIELRWSQKLPWPGKRALRREVASGMAGAAEEDLAEAAGFLAARVKTAWYDLYLLERRIEVAREDKLLLQDFVRIAEKKYAVGRGVQADVTRAHVALSKALDRIIALEREREVARGRVNLLLNRLPQEPLEAPEDLPRLRLGVDLEALQALAEENRPALRRLDRLVERAEAGRELARKGLRPDFTAGIGYRFRDEVTGDPVAGEDFVSASLMVNVPLWARNKQKMRVAESDEEIRRLEWMREQMRFAIFTRIQELAARLEAGRREILLYETGILPQAEQSLESSRSGYQVNRLEFLALLDAKTTLHDEEIEYYRLLTGYQKDLARLEAEVGMPLGVPEGEVIR
jgi:outer membrane protein TolC